MATHADNDAPPSGRVVPALGLLAALALGTAALATPRRAGAFIFTGGPVYDAMRGVQILEQIAELGSQVSAAQQWLTHLVDWAGSIGARGQSAVGDDVAGYQAGDIIAATDSAATENAQPGVAAGSADTGATLRGVSPRALNSGTGQSIRLAGTVPRFDSLDTAPDTRVLADPSAARLYSRAAFGTQPGASMAVKTRIQERRAVEYMNATYDAHGIATSEGVAAGRAGVRVQRLTAALSAAQTARDNDEIALFTALAVLEEIAAVRALAAAWLRFHAADALARLAAAAPLPATLSR